VIAMKAKMTLFVLMLAAMTLCAHSETASRPETATISIHDFSFSPTSITVVVGTTVRWKNFDGEPHTIRSIDTSFRSDPLDQNDSFTFRFDKPGTYRYVCSIHPQMVGTIVVKAAN
jgi:plastocyanin